MLELERDCGGEPLYQFEMATSTISNGTCDNQSEHGVDVSRSASQERTVPHSM